MESSFLIQVSSLMKKTHEIGMLKVTIILLPFMKKENKQEKVCKRLLLHFHHYPHQLMKFPQHHPLLEAQVKRTPCLRSLQDIYEVTKNQNDLTLFFFFAHDEK